MRNFWIVAWHEYHQMVARKGFLIGVLGIPLFIITIMGAIVFVATHSQDGRPLGYVDQEGIIVTVEQPEKGVALVGFSDETTAQAALENQEIQAYYVLPEDYRETRQVELYFWDKAPANDMQKDFARFIRNNLAAELPAEVKTRLVDGPQLTVRSMNGRLEMGDGNILGFLLPLIASILFVIVVMVSAGYMLQIVTREKEDRTIEILLTSLSPEQLIGGKALGLMGVALTELVIWIITACLGLAVAARFFDWSGLSRVPWDFLVVIVLFFLPSYALIAGLMTAVGGSVTELRQGQQVAGMLNLLFIAPQFFMVVILSNPNSPLVQFLTFFPTTAFMTVSLRWSMSGIPFWQLALSWMILVLTALFSVWASARIFRAGMLSYGQSLSLSGAIKVLRQSKA